MGCDIHCVVQAREHPNRPWEFVPYCPEKYKQTKNYEDLWAYKIHSGLADRNYTWFAVLAGVRGDVPCIAEPRGFPDDLDNPHEIPCIYGPYGDVLYQDDPCASNMYVYLGDHSYSYVYLQELLDYKHWSDTAYADTAHVRLHRYKTYLKASQSINNQKRFAFHEPHIPDDAWLLTPDQAADPDIHTQMQATFLRNVFVKIETIYTISYACSHQIQHTIPWLLTLAPTPNDVRLVFGFDS